MVDRIMGNRGFGPLGNVSQTGKNAATKKGVSSKSDRVDFSSVLQNASQTRETSATQDTARAEKLQALKAQIDSGCYQPDLEKVASSLLPFMLKES